eukprot:GEMP01000513.1.p1 GENE.GEMP01000513.1~~GEMP01000513.1.p1  ORF type:complete len:612 (-),score=125.29 GEMP01000513.1:2959-4794(-)
MENMSPKSTVSKTSSKKRQHEEEADELKNVMEDIEENVSENGDESKNEKKKAKNNETQGEGAENKGGGKSEESKGKDKEEEKGESEKCDGSLGSVVKFATKEFEEKKATLKELARKKTEEAKRKTLAAKKNKQVNKGNNEGKTVTTNDNTTPEKERETTNPNEIAASSDHAEGGPGGEPFVTGSGDKMNMEKGDDVKPGKVTFDMDTDNDMALATEEEKWTAKKNEEEAIANFEGAFDDAKAKGDENTNPEVWADMRKDADHKVLLEEMNAESSLHVRVSDVMLLKIMEELNNEFKNEMKNARPGSRDFGCSIKIGVITYMKEWMSAYPMKNYYENRSDMDLNMNLNELEKRYMLQLFNKAKRVLKDVWENKEFYARTTGPLRIIENSSGLWNERAESNNNAPDWEKIWAARKVWWSMTSSVGDSKNLFRLIRMISQLNYLFEKTLQGKAEIDHHRLTMNFHAESPQLAVSWERIKRSAIASAIWQQGIKVDEHIRDRNKQIFEEKRNSITSRIAEENNPDASEGSSNVRGGKVSAKGGKKGKSKGGKMACNWGNLIANQTKKLICKEKEGKQEPIKEKVSTLHSKAPGAKANWWKNKDRQENEWSYWRNN